MSKFCSVIVKSSVLREVMVLALLATGSLCRAVPAAAQGGAYCLYQCDAQCYGQAGPYCRSGCMARCPASPRPPEFYGSVYATSDGSGAYGFSYGKNNQYDAMAEAKRQCKARGGPCQRLLVFVNKCAAVIYARRDGRIVDISGAAEPSQADATRKASQLCERENPGASCEIAREYCAAAQP